MILLLAVVFTKSVQSQTDSLKLKLAGLEKKVDSLSRLIGDTRSRMVTHSDFEGIFRSINEEDQEFTGEDRRSKRRALDSLFRAAVEKPGQLTFTGQFMNVFHWDGKFDNSVNTAVGLVDLFAISSFGKKSLVFINLQGVGGNGPSGVIPGFASFHAGAGSLQSADGLDRITILEAWAEYTFRNATLTAGKIDLTNYFDPNSVANDEYSQFLGGAFTNSTALAAPGNGPGLVMNSTIFKGFSLQVGLASGDNNGDNIFEDLFTIFQVGESFKINEEEVGAVRLYAYNNTAIKNSRGYGLSADGRLAKRMYLYGRYGKNNDAYAGDFGVNNGVSGGIQLRNLPFYKTTSLTGGIAYAATGAFTEESRPMKKETMMEAYLRLNVKKVFFLSLHYQAITNALGQEGADLSVFALRTRVAF